MSGSGSGKGGGSGDNRDQDSWKQSERAGHIAEHLEKQLPPEPKAEEK